MQREDAEGAAELGAAEGGRFAGGEGAEFAGATLDEMAGKMIGERSSAGAGTRRVGKDVEVGERAGFDELQGGGVVGIGFAGKAGDHVGADGGVGQVVVDKFDAASVMFGAIPAMHGGEDAIRGGLQRHVEMGSYAIGGSEEFDEVPGDIERLDGADAEAFDRGFGEDAAEKIEKFDARSEVAPVSAEIDAAENDFAETRVGEALDFGENGVRRKAARFAADKGNNTEGAAGVAAVLNF